MQTLIIGDIHGCYDEMIDLINHSGICSGDCIVSVGDFVDRGPKSFEVVRFLEEHRSTGGELRTLAIRGNHEHKHLLGAKGEMVLSLSQEIVRKQVGNHYPACLDFFKSLPYFLELEGATIVHGGLDPDPGICISSQLPEILCGTRRGEHLLAEKWRVPWFEAYKGEIPVVFGHVDFLKNGEPLIYKDRVFGLDTGCVFGGRLTGLLIPSYKIVSVPSRGNHWLDLRREYLPQRPVRQPRPSRPPSQAVLEWDAGAESALSAIISWTIKENARLLAQLHTRTGYDTLTSREKGDVYETLIADSPVRSLLHLARHGKLARNLAKRFLKTPDRTLKIEQLLKI